MKYNKYNRITYRIKKRNRSNRPILYVKKTEKHMYAHIISDNKKICEVSTIDTSIKGYNMEGAKQLGQKVGQEAKDNNITTVVFNRNQYLYTGRIEAFAEGAREFLEF